MLAANNDVESVCICLSNYHFTYTRVQHSEITNRSTGRGTDTGWWRGEFILLLRTAFVSILTQL